MGSGDGKYHFTALPSGAPYIGGTYGITKQKGLRYVT